MENSAIPDSLGDLQTPCFVVNIDKVKANCAQMQERCDTLGVNLRPHMKTHKTIEGGSLMTHGTKKGIAVSTIKEIEYFAQAGFDDILYAFTFTKDKIPRLQRLNTLLQKFHVMVDSMEAVDALQSSSPVEVQPVMKSKAGSEDIKKWSVWLEVDCGYHRGGIPWDSIMISDVVKKISSSNTLQFAGLYVHEGNAYEGQGKDELKMAGNKAVEHIISARNQLGICNISCPTIAVGSTPSCSKPGKLMANVDELHPGNYIFYDYMQYMMGACNETDIACRVATRIIGHYPQRNQMLVDAGFTALSHDGIGKLPFRATAYVDGHTELKYFNMSQEVGYIEACGEGQLEFDRYPIGSMLFLLPYHSCATASMHSLFFVHQGEKIVNVWVPCRGW